MEGHGSIRVGDRWWRWDEKEKTLKEDNGNIRKIEPGKRENRIRE